MNRTGLYAALAIGTAVGVIFGLYPELDLRLAHLFFDPAALATGEVATMRRWIMVARNSAMWLIAALLVPAIVAVLLKLVLPHRPMLISARAAVFLIVTMALGPGLAVNGLAKDQWGRPRPIDVAQMGGSETFVPWWDPRGDCPNNCSFVSGDVAGAFWTLAPAALAPAPWRPFAYGAAIAFGASVGVMRMLFGAHFFTDVVFAGIITFLIIWLTYNVLYRWWADRLSDAVLEQGLARLARPFRRLGVSRPQ